MDFPDKWAAIVWICCNQLGRRNITDEQKTVLIGEAYKAQKMSQGAQIGNSNAKNKVTNVVTSFQTGRGKKSQINFRLAKELFKGLKTMSMASMKQKR